MHAAGVGSGGATEIEAHAKVALNKQAAAGPADDHTGLQRVIQVNLRLSSGGF